MGCPPRLSWTNGPEMISKALHEWAYRRGVRLNFIEPGKPVQNAFVESFNGCVAARVALQRRMSQRALVPASGRCPPDHRGLADRLQLQPAPLGAQLRYARRLRTISPGA